MTAATSHHPCVRLLRRFWLAMTRALRIELAALATVAIEGGNTSVGGVVSAGNAIASLLGASGGGGGGVGGSGGRSGGGEVLVNGNTTASSSSLPPASSDFVRGVLAEHYPRFHYLLLDVLSRAARAVAARTVDEDAAAAVSAGGAGVVGGFVCPSGLSLLAHACAPSRLAWAAAPLQKLFLGKSMARLNEAAGALFPREGDAGAGAAARRKRNGADTLPSPPIGSQAANIAAAAVAAGFTPATEFDRYMEEPPARDPPTPAATGILLRLIVSELAAARPPASAAVVAGILVGVVGGGGGGGGGVTNHSTISAASTSSHTTRTTALPAAFMAAISAVALGGDAVLVAAVARNVASALRLVAARAEAAAATGPAAVAVAEHFMPTPAQLCNNALVARLDELRAGVARAASDLPLLPPLDRLVAAVSSVAVRHTADIRAASLPLAPSLPPVLLAVSAIVGGGGGGGGGAVPHSSVELMDIS